MMRWLHAAAVSFLCLGAATAHGQCTQTINPGADLNSVANTAAPGSVICLNAGTYLPSAVVFPADSATFAIGNAVTVRGTPGTTPAQVILQGGASTDYVMKFTNVFGAGKVASGSTLQGVTIQGGQGGIQVFNFTNVPAPARLTDITLKDIVINTASIATASSGVLLKEADRINIDNVTVTSRGTGFNLIDVTASLVMNSTVTNTVNPDAAALVLLGGSRNTVVGNTLGSPKVSATYPIDGLGVVIDNSVANRFEDNVVQGFKTDGVNITTLDRTGVLPPAQATLRATENYVGKNTVISTRFADGFQFGGAGIWSNCGTHNTWVYGNEAQGVPECGICVYNANSNMVLGNKLHHNGILGLLVSGGTETHGDCSVAGGAYRGKPTSTFVMSNAAYFNKSDQLQFRSSDNTEIARNHLNRRDGLGGTQHPDCLTAGCQSAITFDILGAPNVGARIVANIAHELGRGFWSDDGATTGIQFAGNKMIQPSPFYNRYYFAGTTNWDSGSAVGGNYWTAFPGANRNPSVGAPYGTAGAGNPALGVFYNSGNATGNIVDRFPFRDEHMGRGWGVTVYEPRSGASLAQSSRRTVRWNAPGCSYVDIALDGSTALGTSLPNTGYAIVTVPAGAPIGAHNVVVSCKNSAGTVMGSGTSPNFTVSASTLQLKAPGRDDVFNASTQVLVAWKKAAAIATVDVELSIDGGATFPTVLAAGVTGSFARVTLPATPTAYAVIRVRSGATIDHTDGVFAIRGAGQAFTNVTAGRKFVMGGLERLEWRSPSNSSLVDITMTVSAVTFNLATNLPDRGFFDWIVPEMPVGAASLQINFKSAAGGALGSATNNTGTTAAPTTITLAPISFLATGTSANLTPTANSGLAVTLTSLTPGVCTVAGGIVNGVSAGTCTVAANQAGNATYAAAAQVTSSFTVGSNQPRLVNISTRMQVLTGNDVMIGGFVIGGGSNKTVAIVATGPSLAAFGIANPLANPTLRLVRSSDQAVLATNDDWQSAPNAAQLTAAGFAPSNPLEAAILINLPPGAYTAIVEGVSGGTGVGVVAVYEVDAINTPLVNISTRGRVLTGNDVMIGGFVINGSGPQTVAIVGTGPSLAPFGITNPLPNPTLSLVRSSDQAVLASNDNWGSAANAAAIQASGFAPTDPLESAILISLPPGAYTVILSGVGGGTGVGVVGVYTTTATP